MSSSLISFDRYQDRPDRFAHRKTQTRQVCSWENTDLTTGLLLGKHRPDRFALRKTQT
jgi:hypothetical protein